MLSNKIGKSTVVQMCYNIHLVTMALGVGAREIIKQSEKFQTKNCKILNYKAKETHLIPQELQYVFQLGYPFPRKDTAVHQNLE